MARSAIVIAGIVACLALASCGTGGESGSSAASVATPITGTFVDSPVNGLHYTSLPSNPAGGVTANGGQYQCVPGDTITFDLGGRTIGSGQPCGPLVTVVSVFGATSTTDLRVRNLAQLLLTLSGIPAGSQPIDLPETIPATLPARLDFADTTFEQMLQTALPDRTLVSQEQVAAHLRASFTTLKVSSNGGQITSTPAGLVCTVGTCSYDFAKGTRVTLAALGPGFTGWSGTAGCTGTGPCQILLGTIQAIRAIFVPPPSPPGGGGALTITGAPASVGGTFVAAAALTQVTPPDSQTNIASVAWSEAVTTSPIHSEILAIAFDATNNVPQASAILFSLFHGSAFTVWSCVEFLTFCGITVNGATGTVTFNNAVLSDLVSGAPPITLNGTLIFTPVAPPSTSLSITTASPLAAGTRNQAYSATLAASGGTPPFTWSVVSGAWPAGLTLDPLTGAISGTPTTAGTSTFTIQVRDSAMPQRSTQKQFSLTITAGGAGLPPFVLEAYVKASNTGSNDGFGVAVALSGDTLVVGAPGEESASTGINGEQNNDFGFASGAAYVFVRDGSGTWIQQAYLKGTSANGIVYPRGFGGSVAISGDTLVVGAPGEENIVPPNPFRGAVYVFTRTNGIWIQQAYLQSPPGGANFGVSVALDADTLAVGANIEEDLATGPGAGAVYVYVRSNGMWIQQAHLKASNPEAHDEFGRSVALSGDTLAVGAPFEGSAAIGINGNQTDNSAPASGAVYVFTRANGVWSQQAYVKASNTQADDWFGSSAGLDGNTLVVGAPFEASAATGVNGNQADNSAYGSGAAYVFTRTDGVWSQQAYVKASNDGGGFGLAVSISGDVFVVGAEGEGSSSTGVNGNQENSFTGAGAAYVFVRTPANGTWNQTAYVKASNTDAHDLFGRGVVLSGNSLVVGARNEGSSATGINGNQADNSALGSGAVYVYRAQ